MGIFDLLSKEGRDKSALNSSIKKTTDKFVQSVDRFGAMEKLRDIGSDEALYGLCRRFSFYYDKTIEDEQEKQWVEETLAGFGEKALPALRKFILGGETLSYPLKVLEKIATPDKILTLVDEVLEREEPGYARHPEKKIQLLSWLGEWKEGEPAGVARRIVPYLKDFDETVRFTAIEALGHAPPDAETTRAALIEALLRPEEESRRIQVRVGEVLAERGWRIDDTPEHKDAVVKLVASKLPEFTVEKEKLVRKAR